MPFLTIVLSKAMSLNRQSTLKQFGLDDHCEYNSSPGLRIFSISVISRSHSEFGKEKEESCPGHSEKYHLPGSTCQVSSIRVGKPRAWPVVHRDRVTCSGPSEFSSWLEAVATPLVLQLGPPIPPWVWNSSLLLLESLPSASQRRLVTLIGGHSHQPSCHRYISLFPLL